MDSNRDIRERCEPHLQRLAGLLGVLPDNRLIEAACETIEAYREAADAEKKYP